MDRGLDLNVRTLAVWSVATACARTERGELLDIVQRPATMLAATFRCLGSRSAPQLANAAQLRSVSAVALPVTDAQPQSQPQSAQPSTPVWVSQLGVVRNDWTCAHGSHPHLFPKALPSPG